MILILLLIIGKYKMNLKAEVTGLEQNMVKYSIKGGDSPRKGVHTSSNTEIFTDELIIESLLLMLQENVEMYLRAIRTSTTNDYVREIFIKQAVEGIKRLDNSSGRNKYLR